jgi:hypothetical protein
LGRIASFRYARFSASDRKNDHVLTGSELRLRECPLVLFTEISGHRAISGV